jgi:predicted Zn-dependent peptidase
VVSLQVDAGSLNAGENVWLSTLTAQMLREGSAGRSGAQVAAEAAAMGGNLGVFATTHQTIFNLYVLSNRAADAVRLVGDVARRPTFPASELERVRQNLVRALAVARSQPQPAADAALAAATQAQVDRQVDRDAAVLGLTSAQGALTDAVAVQGERQRELAQCLDA